MGKALPAPKFRHHPALLLAGLLRTYALADAENLIPVQWGDFFALDVPEIHTSSVIYGVICRREADTMEYMTAIEVPSFDDVETPYREALPPAHYAVFTVDKVAGISQEWESIHRVWMPSSAYQAAGSPAFERYDERYDPETRTGAIELWVPLEPAR
jgi:AraC family transcriptional regulator